MSKIVEKDTTKKIRNANLVQMTVLNVKKERNVMNVNHQRLFKMENASLFVKMVVLQKMVNARNVRLIIVINAIQIKKMNV